MDQPLHDPEKGRAYFQTPAHGTDGQHRGVAAVGNGGGGDDGHVKPFRLQMSKADTADRRPKAAGRSELLAYHPEHDLISCTVFRKSRSEEVQGNRFSFCLILWRWEVKL
jgi:hypothetical protein